jgi:hypothetical protein
MLDSHHQRKPEATWTFLVSFSKGKLKSGGDKPFLFLNNNLDNKIIGQMFPYKDFITRFI